MPLDIPGFIYAGAVAAGGILGYYKAGKYLLIYLRWVYMIFTFYSVIMIRNMNIFDFFQAQSHPWLQVYSLAALWLMEHLKSVKILQIIPFSWPQVLFSQELWATVSITQER